MCCRTRHQRRHLCAMKTNVVLPPWPVQQLPKATGFASEITWKGGSLELSDSLGTVLTVSCRWRCRTKNFLRRGGGRRRSIQLWPAEAQLRIPFQVPLVGHNAAVPLLSPLLTHHSHPYYKPGRKALSPLPPRLLSFPLRKSVINGSASAQLRGRRYLRNGTADRLNATGCRTSLARASLQICFPFPPTAAPSSEQRQAQPLH